MPTDAEDDPFFSLTDTSNWNACIGTQAYDENYVDGYTDAALLLAETVITNKMYGSRDTIVFPILYNARHGVELTLKYLIKRLREVGLFNAEHAIDHDILSHWQFLASQNLGDETLRSDLSRLEPYVQSLANIDDDGQSFRYAERRDGQASLGEHSLASIVVIRDSLRVLRGILEALKHRLWSFEEERKTGTFTAECSRLDLIAIAKALPARDNWDSQEFLDAKALIMKRFTLGSRKFSKAVDKIQSSRELKLIIGVQSELAHLTDEHAELVVEQWRRLHPDRRPREDDLGLDYRERSFSDIFKDDRPTSDVKEILLAALANDEIADIDTVFYIGRDNQFSEHYDTMLAANKREHEVQGDRWIALYHVMSKTNFAQGLADGMDRLGRPDLASRVRALAAPV